MINQKFKNAYIIMAILLITVFFTNTSFAVSLDQESQGDDYSLITHLSSIFDSYKNIVGSFTLALAETTGLSSTPGTQVLSRFWVIADTPYSSAATTNLTKFMSSVPPSVEFVAHLGDLRAGAKDIISVSYLESIANILKKSIAPVFIVLGDNEYNDTKDPIKSLENWKTVFGSFDKKWTHNFAVKYQPERQENFAFVSNGVLFIGINLVGGSIHDKAEWATRSADDLKWIQANFNEYKNTISSAVIFAQTTPNTAGYTTFKTGFVQTSKGFAKPILYLQGDQHVWLLEKSYAGLPNVTKVTVAQTGFNSDSNPLSVSITNDPNQPFSFDRGFPSDLPTNTGTQLDDILIGGSSANKINGLGGADILNGMAGNDTLTGGADADVFKFNSSLSSSNVDTINDFEQGLDKIELALSIFTKTNAGYISSAMLNNNTSGTKALTKSVRFIYDRSAGYLYYDKDGSGSTKPVLFLKFVNKPINLSTSDIIIK